MPSGRTALSRTWRQGRWDLTDIGKQLYRNETEVVVEVPVRIQSSGAREWHTDNTWLPVSSTMAPRLPDLYPNAAAIKAYIRSLCEVHADGLLILTVSDALYFISETPPHPREWRISTQRTLPDGTVEARPHVLMLGKILKFEHIRRTDYLIDLEETGRCW